GAGGGRGDRRDPQPARARMPAGAQFLYGGGAGDAARGGAQAGGRGDQGRHLLRDSSADRAPRLRRVQRARAGTEAAARADRVADLDAVAAVGIRPDALSSSELRFATTTDAP